MRKIIIAENHFAVRNSINRVLSEIPGLEVVAEAINARELLYKLRKIEVDLILLDISLPGQTGIELLAGIRKKYPAIPVLVMGMGADADYEQMILQEGAAGFVCKEEIATEVVTAISVALNLPGNLVRTEQL
ncbi:MAG: response regulator transcription factor [Sphingobacteriales bacterium]|nr:MAG: response regulator transcription factor [Sphingobacteriales bacterium]